MPSLFAITAPFVLILPVLGTAGVMVHDDDVVGQQSGPISAAPDYDEPPEGPYSAMEGAEQRVSNPLDALHSGQTWRQTRIEQQIIIRITPYRGRNRNQLLAELPQRGLNTRFEEREMDRCIRVDRIAGVQTGTGNRLLLFLRDQRIISVNLERTCRARDFYSGFYVQRTEDGQLCVDRDALHSRSGAKCEVEAMRQLVAVRD